MIYRITRYIVRLGIRGFFDKIHVSGAEKFDEPAPAIVIANHPSALIDPLVIATITDRRLSFITAAEYFGKGLQKWLFEHEFNMIPVYRPQKYEGKTVSNKDMFRDCYKCLNNNGCIVIFPEGNSVTEKHLRSLKTGVARILAGFKKRYPDKEVKVIPVGLNYSSAHQFQSDIFISVGEPISFNWIPPEKEGAEKKQIHELTEAFHTTMKAETLHFNQRELEPLVENIERVWNNQLLHELGFDENDSLRSFRIRQRIIEAAEFFYQNDPQKIRNLSDQIRNYIQKLKEYDLTPAELDTPPSVKLVTTLKLILGLPFFILGVVINGIPYYISKQLFLTKLKPKITDYGAGGLSPAFVATLIYAAGMVVFLGWLITIGIILTFTLHWWSGIVFFFGAYYLGRFSMKYRSFIIQLKSRISSGKKRSRIGKPIQPLTEERNLIISRLNDLLRAYEKEGINSSR
jgi:glycerol-3-phosphate O-acyltransferase/dihydroxyacetone phosphate acyltransferase